MNTSKENTTTGTVDFMIVATADTQGVLWKTGRRSSAKMATHVNKAFPHLTEDSAIKERKAIVMAWFAHPRILLASKDASP